MKFWLTNVLTPFRSVIWLAPFVAALSLPACATADTYSAKSIAATVVDGDTGEPLEGVNVIARWMLEEKRMGFSVGDLDLMETVTDKNGKFLFRAWEGKAPPTRTTLSDTSTVQYETRLSSGSPELIFFKVGYKPTRVGNYNYLSPELRDQYHTWERSSDWSGKIIKMEKFKGSLENYSSLANGTLSGLGNRIECAWKKIPFLLTALLREKERLEREGVRWPRNSLSSIERMQQQFDNYGNCGSAKEFLKEYAK